MLQIRPPRPKAVPGGFWEYTVSQSRNRLRFWAAVQLPKVLLQSALLGFLFSGGKLPQLEIGGRRPTIPAGTDGIGTVSRSACARLTGKAEAAAPQPFLPFSRSPVSRSGACSRKARVTDDGEPADRSPERPCTVRTLRRANRFGECDPVGRDAGRR